MEDYEPTAPSLAYTDSDDYRRAYTDSDDDNGVDYIAPGDKPRVNIDSPERSASRKANDDQLHIAQIGDASEFDIEEDDDDFVRMADIGETAYSPGIEPTGLDTSAEQFGRYLEMSDEEDEGDKLAALSLVHVAKQAYHLGEYENAQPQFVRALEMYRASGDRSEIARTLKYLGKIAYRLGDFDGARQYLDESILLYRPLGDRPSLGAVLAYLGKSAYRQHRYDEANTLLNESLDINRDLGIDENVAHVLNELGKVAFRMGQYPEARAYLKESLDISTLLADKPTIACSLVNLAEADYEMGDYQEAQAMVEESREMFEQLGETEAVAECNTLWTHYARNARSLLKRVTRKVKSMSKLIQRPGAEDADAAFVPLTAK